MVKRKRTKETRQEERVRRRKERRKRKKPVKPVPPPAPPTPPSPDPSPPKPDPDPKPKPSPSGGSAIGTVAKFIGKITGGLLATAAVQRAARWIWSQRPGSVDEMIELSEDWIGMNAPAEAEEIILFQREGNFWNEAAIQELEQEVYEAGRAADMFFRDEAFEFVADLAEEAVEAAAAEAAEAAAAAEEAAAAAAIEDAAIAAAAEAAEVAANIGIGGELVGIAAGAAEFLAEYGWLVLLL